MANKISLSREAALAALPETAPAWELHGAIARAASDALHNHLRECRFLADQERRSYEGVYAVIARQKVAVRQARRARTAWDRAEDASSAALACIPASLHKASYTAEEWVARMGYRTP